jgi:hypothetical protein
MIPNTEPRTLFTIIKRETDYLVGLSYILPPATLVITVVFLQRNNHPLHSLYQIRHFGTY